jgi:lipopolysaccharide export system permease protein
MEMLSITELIVNRGVKVVQVLSMVAYLLPEMILFALPAASLIAVVVAFLRLASDNEIIAIKSSGVSVYQMLPPVALLSVAACLLALFVGIYGVPWGHKSFKNLLFEIAESKADVGIKTQVFSEPFDGVTFYVNSFSEQDNTMKNLFVVDRRDERVTNTVVAAEGKISVHAEEKIITLQFRRGTIFIVENKKDSARTIGFDSYDMNIGLKDILASLSEKRLKPKEMSVAELWAGLTAKGEAGPDYNSMMIELLERLTIPLGVFLMGIIGMPLGAQLRVKGKSAGVGVSLAIFLVYYMFLAGAKSVSETGVIPPAIGMWAPDALLLILCGLLFRLAAKEKSIRFLPKAFPGLRKLRRQALS